MPFPKVTSETGVFEKGVYAWTASAMDESLTDDQIIDALKKRLQFLQHVGLGVGWRVQRKRGLKMFQRRLSVVVLSPRGLACLPLCLPLRDLIR